MSYGTYSQIWIFWSSALLIPTSEENQSQQSFQTDETSKSSYLQCHFRLHEKDRLIVKDKAFYRSVSLCALHPTVCWLICRPHLQKPVPFDSMCH